MDKYELVFYLSIALIVGVGAVLVLTVLGVKWSGLGYRRYRKWISQNGGGILLLENFAKEVKESRSITVGVQRVQCESLQKYRNFNTGKWFLEWYAGLSEELKEWCKSASAQALDCINDAYSHAQEDWVVASEEGYKFKESTFILCYKNMLSEQVLKLCAMMYPTLRVSYTSPAGRKHYHFNKTYGFEEVLELLSRRRDNSSRLKTERSKMTPKLRYSILKRDGFKCVLCGATAESSGKTLEVDHIYPIARGGLTVPENLRTLCFDCNRGKSDSIEGGSYENL